MIEEDVELEKSNPVESKKLDGINILSNHQQVDELEKGKDKENEAVVTTLIKPSPLFPHRLKKKANDTKFSKFMTTMK